MKLVRPAVAAALNLAAAVLPHTSGDDSSSTGSGGRWAVRSIAVRNTYTLWYDDIYDQANASLSTVACSTGEHGLIVAGYNIFNDLPTYPFIGGAPQIQSWDSPNCGTCWELTYTNGNGVPGSLSFTAINTGPPGGFSISWEGLNRLTGGLANVVDGTPITAIQLPQSDCGMVN